MRDNLITKSAKYLASNPQERCKNTCFLVRHQTWSWERPLSLPQNLQVNSKHSYYPHSFRLSCVFVLRSCALVRTKLVRMSGFFRISQQVLSTRCCKISKSLIGSEYTKVFKCSHGQESRGLCRPVDWTPTSYLVSTASLVQVLRENVEKMRWCPIMH
jgi:hypothetical protein